MIPSPNALEYSDGVLRLFLGRWNEQRAVAGIASVPRGDGAKPATARAIDVDGSKKTLDMIRMKHPSLPSSRPNKEIALPMGDSFVDYQIDRDGFRPDAQKWIELLFQCLFGS